MSPRRFFMVAGPTALALFLVPAIVIGLLRWTCWLADVPFGPSDVPFGPSLGDFTVALALIATLICAMTVGVFAFSETEGE